MLPPQKAMFTLQLWTTLLHPFSAGHFSPGLFDRFVWVSQSHVASTACCHCVRSATAASSQNNIQKTWLCWSKATHLVWHNKAKHLPCHTAMYAFVMFDTVVTVCATNPNTSTLLYPLLHSFCQYFNDSCDWLSLLFIYLFIFVNSLYLSKKLVLSTTFHSVTTHRIACVL